MLLAGGLVIEGRTRNDPHVGAASLQSWFMMEVAMDAGVASKVGVKRLTLEIRIKLGSANHTDLYTRMRHRPVCRRGDGAWERCEAHTVKSNYDAVLSEFTLTIGHVLWPESADQFAFCYPWSSLDNDRHIHLLQQQSIQHPSPSLQLTRHLLVQSLEARPVDILTITNPPEQGAAQEAAEFAMEPLFTAGLFPHDMVTANNRDDEGNDEEQQVSGPVEDEEKGEVDIAGVGADAGGEGKGLGDASFGQTMRRLRPHKGFDRQVCFVSARVHPGESPASLMMKGFLDFITSDHDDAVALRSRFIFLCVPMLNPDGVDNGNYRTNSRGTDCNRVYHTATLETQPVIFAVGALVQSLHEQGFRFFAYVDLHAHKGRDGLHVLGNDYVDDQAQIFNEMFTRVLANRSHFLTPRHCEYSGKVHERSSPDDQAGTRPDGIKSGRMHVSDITRCVRCYTVETHYSTPPLPEKVAPGKAKPTRLAPGGASPAISSPARRKPSVGGRASTSGELDGAPAVLALLGTAVDGLLSKEDYENMGKAVALALLDISSASTTEGMMKSGLTLLKQRRRAEQAKIRRGKAKA